MKARTLVLALLLSSAPAAQSLSADEEPLRSRSFTVSSDGAVLAATLYLPETSSAATGATPGIVLLHGSGPSTRSFQRPLADWFTARGFAVLAFDKRGCGESTGNWIRASLDDLAADASAVLTALRQQPEVAAGRVGLFGHSQGGWVVPRAVALGARPDFAIVVAGGGARPTTVESFGYLNAFEHAGLSAEERERGFGWIRRYFDYLATCTGREALAQGLEGESQRPWIASAPIQAILPSEPNCPNWSWVATYDPLPDIARLGNLPVLVLFGGRDRSSPAEVSAARWRLGLTQAGNDPAAVIVLPSATHSLQVGMDSASGHGSRGEEHAAPAGRGYLEEIEDWIRKERIKEDLSLAKPVPDVILLGQATSAIRRVFKEKAYLLF